MDYEYKRAGTATLLLFCEPLLGWRDVTVQERRTKIDWAREIERLLPKRYVQADKLLLIYDNLKTRTRGAFYEAFDPAFARAMVSRLKFRQTPKHGSLSNVAENELSSLTIQCLKDRRFGTIARLRESRNAYSQHTNYWQRDVDWQFKIDAPQTPLRLPEKHLVTPQ